MLWFAVPILIVVALTLALSVWLVGKVPLVYTVRNLTVRWKTTALTAVAFTLVVGLLSVMLAFVNGMYALTQVSGDPNNVIVLSDGAPDEVLSSLTPKDIGNVENQDGILREDGRPVVSRETYLIANQPVENASAGRPKRRFLQVRGIEDPQMSARVHGLELLPGGRWFSGAGVVELPAAAGGGPAPSAIEAVLGEGIARELGRDRPPDQLARARNPARLDVGDVFYLGDVRGEHRNDQPWIVVGVMQSGGSTFDSEVWAKRAVVAPFFGKDVYTSLVLRAPSPAKARELKAFLTTQFQETALQAQLETDYFANLAGTTWEFLYGIIFITAVMAIGGIFGVMNTMFAAVSQRTKDLGVLRLLGYSRRQILVSLVLESVLIAVIGGLLGCALGRLADGWTANSIVSGGQAGGKFVVLKLSVDLGILSTGMLAAALMGLLGGLVPALHAMRLRALEALR